MAAARSISGSRDGPAKFLAGYKQVLLADAYGGYEGICLEGGIIQDGCWSHGRRKVSHITRQFDWLAPPPKNPILENMEENFASWVHDKFGGVEISTFSRAFLSPARSAEGVLGMTSRLRYGYCFAAEGRHPCADGFSGPWIHFFSVNVATLFSISFW